MSIAYLRAVMLPEDGLLPTLTPTETFVLLALADSADEHKDGWCWPSLRRVTQITRLSERAARNALRELERLGVLQTVAVPGNSNYYRLAFAPNAKRLGTPAPDAGHPGTPRPPPRHQMPATPAPRAPDPKDIRNSSQKDSQKPRRRAADAVKTATAEKAKTPMPAALRKHGARARLNCDRSKPCAELDDTTRCAHCPAREQPPPEAGALRQAMTERARWSSTGSPFEREAANE